MTKQLLTKIASAVFVLFALIGCTEKNQEEGLTSLMLDETSINMVRGDSREVSAFVLPESMAGVTINWSSSDKSIARVDETGVISALGIGKCYITASAEGKSAVCHVLVTEVPIDTLYLNTYTLALTPGGAKELVAIVEPADLEGVEVEWESSDTEVATVNNGRVRGIKAGAAIIYASVPGFITQCNVGVVGVGVEELRISETKLSLIEGDVHKLEAVALPINADDRTITWSSSDEAVVSVSQDGEVTALKEGYAEVTASCGELNAVCEVKVEPLVALNGDYYYSDGTWSTELNSEKTVIGIVFYVGDVTAVDPALAADFPDCTHGLVVATSGEEAVVWMDNYSDYKDFSQISKWVVANTKFVTIESGTSQGDNLNKPLGYNNTKALEAFQTANPDFVVDALTPIINHRTAVPAPAKSSGWYLPSVKDASLICTGVYDGNIYNIGGNKTNKTFLNERLALVEGAILLSTTDMYSTSTENTWGDIYFISESGMVMNYYKGTEGLARAILAF